MQEKDFSNILNKNNAALVTIMNKTFIEQKETATFPLS